ncbi:hypothetical protein F4780DRAFT_188549 [Xylariomycetidae sp. FL0641]|nr:hypothetical protein F4780DRAFT_188549 [Xylariomycetidae sp. FL0641]
MARANKRKHASTAQGTSKGDPPSKKGKTQTDHDQLGVDPTAHHAVLGRFYPQLMSLRDYALSRLPSSSRLRRRKVAAVGLVAKAPGEPLSVDELSLGALLDSTLVGIPRVLSPDQGGRLEGWKTFSQKGDESYVTLSNGIAGYVESQALVRWYRYLPQHSTISSST